MKKEIYSMSCQPVFESNGEEEEDKDRSADQTIFESTRGEYNEGLSWKIIKNFYVGIFDNKISCGHCKKSKNGKISTMTVPRVVFAKNEGGYNSTAVCLDCILEAVGAEEPCD